MLNDISHAMLIIKIIIITIKEKSSEWTLVLTKKRAVLVKYTFKKFRKLLLTIHGAHHPFREQMLYTSVVSKGGER